MSITIHNKKYDINLQYLYLENNQLSSLPSEIKTITNKLEINKTSYEINNLNIECEFIIFNSLNVSINNLPINVKEIWLNKNIKEYDIKLPFNCKILYF